MIVLLLTVVCPRCCKLYNLSDCVIRCGSVEESLKCTHIEYLNHPHHSRRQKCNMSLLKRVHVGKIMTLVPQKVFMYQNVVQCPNEIYLQTWIYYPLQLMETEKFKYGTGDDFQIFMMEGFGRAFIALMRNLFSPNRTTGALL